MPRDYSLPEAILIFMSVLASFYFLFFGYVLARLWYYKGDLGPVPKKYIILPQYLKDKLLAEPYPLRRPPAVLERTDSRAHLVPRNEEKGKEDSSKAKKIRNRLTAALKPNPYRGSTLLDPNIADDDLAALPDTEIRNELLEQKRISRMPHFVQDDCGDGRLFPDVLETDPNAPGDPWARVSFVPGQEGRLNLPSPYQANIPFRKEQPSEENYMTMGLRKLDPARGGWLVVDSSYQEFWEARKEILKTRKGEAIRVEREAEEACVELMQEVVRYLTDTYPDVFEIVEGGFGGRCVRNKLVGEKFRLQKPWDVHPLEICVRLAMEDFNLLAKSEFTGEHRLIASATLFPAGWRLPSRIGKSVTDLYGPVPLWKDLPDVLNEVPSSYFTRMTPNSPILERHSFFIQIQPSDKPRPLSSLLFVQAGKDFFPGRFHDLNPAFILVRRERQTFRRLPTSGAIVFTVKTSVQRLVDLDEEGERNLVNEIRSWPREIATYKGRDLWQRAVISFCEGRGRYAKGDEGVGSQVGALTQISEG